MSRAAGESGETAWKPANGARRAGHHTYLPTALGENHEKDATEVSVAGKYSWKDDRPEVAVDGHGIMYQ